MIPPNGPRKNTKGCSLVVAIGDIRLISLVMVINVGIDGSEHCFHARAKESQLVVLFGK